MNDGKILYKNGFAIVNDYDIKTKELNKIKIYEYQDNINEIIKQENIIEELENNIKEKTEEITNNLILIQKRIDDIKLLITLNIFLAILCNLIGFILVTPYNNLKSVLDIFLLVISASGISSLLIVTEYFSAFDNLRSVKFANKKQNLELKELQKELVKRREFLNQLKNDKSKKKIREANIKKEECIHNIHIDELKEIKDRIFTYCEISKDENKYYEPEKAEKIKTYFKIKKQI